MLYATTSASSLVPAPHSETFDGWISLALTKTQTLLVYHLVAANTAKLQDAKLMGNLVDTKQLY